MAKLNERNSKFVVIQSEFHGGRCIGFYNSLNYAKRIVAQNTINDCHCGACAYILPINKIAYSELINDNPALFYKGIKCYEAMK